MLKYKLIISLFFLTFGLSIIGSSILTPFEPVTATITQSSKEYIKSSSDRPGKSIYRFKYEYSYLDQTYVSTRYTYGGRNRSMGVCKYRVGDTTQAYININKPSYSVIERKVSGFIYSITGIGFLMVIHTSLDYILDRNIKATRTWLRKTHKFLGMFIGLVIFVGGIGYFLYVLIIVARMKCVS